jgi:hypothetical protein
MFKIGLIDPMFNDKQRQVEGEGILQTAVFKKELFVERKSLG